MKNEDDASKMKNEEGATSDDEISTDAYTEYYNQITESGGFDVEDFPDFIGRIIPYRIHERNLPELINLSKLAIEEYNKTENANFEFVEVEKANIQLCGSSTIYYVTFRAVNRDADGATQTFQAFIEEGFPKLDFEVKFCTLKPDASQGGGYILRQYTHVYRCFWACCPLNSF